MLLRSPSGCMPAARGHATQRVTPACSATRRAAARLAVRGTAGTPPPAASSPSAAAAAAAAAAGSQQGSREPLVLYDISSPLQPPRSYAPNPSKARLALSFKQVPFRTAWVDILDIPAVRQGLGCPAVRKFDDGSDYYTLPMLQDPTSGRVIGDSFDIATYLEATFPGAGAGSLFPQDSTHTGLDYRSPYQNMAFHAPPLTPNQLGGNEAYARFNVQVDTTFSAHVALVAANLPFNPDTAEAVGALFASRARLPSWESVRIPPGEARQQMLAGFRDGLKTLAQLFEVHDSGPYLEGARANYADLIVGGWLSMMEVTMPREEWGELRGWNGGVFGRLHDALQRGYWVCT